MKPYGHAHHHLPLAVRCTYCRPGLIGLPCTLGSAYHAPRREAVLKLQLDDADKARVLDLLVQLKGQLRGPDAGAVEETRIAITKILQGAAAAA